jgi:hypothetical protein
MQEVTMIIYAKTQCVLLAILVSLVVPLAAMAQDEKQAQEGAQPIASENADGAASDEAGLARSAATDKNDKSGTNPINFQRDFRIYNEYLWLNTVGDGNQNLTTLEYRTPFAGGKWQFRTRVPVYNIVNADLNGDGTDDIDDSGFGDINFRLLTVPYFKGANALAFALETFLNTASEDSLGAGTTSLAPVVFFGRFFRGGFGPWQKGGLFAPGLQYKFSIDEDTGRDKTEQIILDINFLLQSEDGQSWLFAEPQIVFDRETDAEFAMMDIEFGWMMTKWWPDLTGQSFYLRPTFTIGADRPTDYGIEVAYKWVGW